VKLDELKLQIEVISKTVQGLREEVNDQALILLIQHSAPTVNGNKIPAKTIKAVLEGLEGLERFVLREVE
jgi:hypothetical protein